jgi:hypothetical protein
MIVFTLKTGLLTTKYSSRRDRGALTETAGDGTPIGEGGEAHHRYNGTNGLAETWMGDLTLHSACVVCD